MSLLSEGELREVFGDAAVLICRGASGFSGRGAARIALRLVLRWIARR